MDVLFSALSIVFLVQISQYLQMQAEESLQFLNESTVSNEFANLCKFWKEHWWPA